MVKKISKKLDLTKKYPNYFTKETRNILRVALILTLLLYGFTLYTNDWQFSFSYVCCSDIGVSQYCELPIGDPYINEFGVLDQEVEYLMAGECKGNKPNIHAQEFNKRALIIVIFAFLTNHALYLRRKKKK